MRRSPCILALVLAVAGAACTDGDGGGDDGGTDGSTSTLSPTTVDPDLRIDWTGGATDLPLPNGWKATPCEAGPTLLCVRDGAATLGVIELNDYPLASFPRVRDVLRRGGSVADALRAEAAAFVASVETDRASTCGAGYTVAARPPASVTVGGEPGMSYGFEATAGGRPVERSLQLATVVDESLYVVSTTAVAAGSCMDDPHLDEFTVEQLGAIEPVVAAAVAASPLPDPTRCANPDTGEIVTC